MCTECARIRSGHPGDVAMQLDAVGRVGGVRRLPQVPYALQQARGLRSPGHVHLAQNARSIYATVVSDAAAILQEARAAAGMSARALAFKADASTTTVTRIEAGTMDPTVGMLTRLLAATGRALELSMRDSPAAATSSLADLVDAWTPTATGDRPDWTRLRAFLDSLALHPHRIRAAITHTPPPSGSAMLDALLAGIADKLADDRGLNRPGWTNAPDRFLSSPWETPGTPRMREAARDQTPPQLLAHGIVASQDSLWRDPTTLGISSSA